MKSLCVCLSLAVCATLAPPASAKNVFIASGGGIRAAIGTNIGLDLLRGQAQIRFDEYHALSGGSWGLAMSLASSSNTWCAALTQSLKDEKGALDPRRLKQTSNVKFGPRSATNPIGDYSAWWTYWSRNVGAFTNAKDLLLPSLPGRGNINIHVAQLVKEGNGPNKAVNDCWFTNKIDDLKCLFPANRTNQSYTSAGVTPTEYRTNQKLLGALTYSSAAWSTLQAKDGVGGIFRAKTPPLSLKPAGGKPTPVLNIEVTDGGDYINLPLMSVINDFHINPQDTKVIALDYTEPDKGKTWGDPPPYDVNFTLAQLKARSPFLNAQITVVDKCQAKLVYKKGPRTLTIHILGFCGPATYQGGQHKLLDKFRTIEIFNTGVLAGKGIAKQWDKAELHFYTQNYGAFLSDRLSAIANAEFGYKPHFALPSLCSPY